MTDPTRATPNRRDVLQAGAAGLAAVSLGEAFGATQETNQQGVPLRPLGKTGEKVSLLGLGGFHSSSPPEERDALRLIQRAVDEGITFLDNCWDYMDGKAEERMGKALAEGNLRDKVFLMTKCCGRDAKEAESNLADSLRRLRTDHLDLWQFHEINYDNDPDWIFAPGGALEFALKAKEQGKVRFIGFTGHKSPNLHRQLLASGIPWDTVQMPINVFDAHFSSFQHKILPMCIEQGIGVIGMKSNAGGHLQRSGAGITPEEALRYSLGLPVSVVVSGMDSLEILRKNMAVADDFEPYDEHELDDLLERARAFSGEGEFEPFKSSHAYDGAEGRKVHNYPLDAAS